MCQSVVGLINYSVAHLHNDIIISVIMVLHLDLTWMLILDVWDYDSHSVMAAHWHRTSPHFCQHLWSIFLLHTYMLNF